MAAASPASVGRALRQPTFGGAAHAIYYVTLAAAGRECLFGGVEPDGAVTLTEFGWMVRREWLRTGFVRPEVDLDAYIVMPNHLHGIIAVSAAGASGQGESAGHAPAPRVAEPSLVVPTAPGRLLGAVLAGFKAMCTVQINHRRGRPGAPVWQRGYVERVVRTPSELELLRRHLAENPARWLARAAASR